LNKLCADSFGANTKAGHRRIECLYVCRKLKKYKRINIYLQNTYVDFVTVMIGIQTIKEYFDVRYLTELELKACRGVTEGYSG
jgi:hypothetical protein